MAFPGIPECPELLNRVPALIRESILKIHPAVLDFRIADGEKQRLLTSPSVVAGSPWTERLCTWGITPVTVFYATDAVSMLVDWLLDYGKLQRGTPILIASAIRDGESHQFIRPQMATREIGKLAECGEATALHLFTWLLRVAECRPYVFPGLETELVGDRLLLHSSEYAGGDLYKFWGMAKVKWVTA
jgi:hypothetical protein